jgi:hypothetical protein
MVLFRHRIAVSTPMLISKSVRIMVAMREAKVGQVGRGAKVLHLPKSWVDGVGIRAGQLVELVFDDILVVIPRPSRQADRVRRAMEEAKR